MVVNSINFLIFFIIVFAIYYLLGKSYKQQNTWLLISSYVFYGIAEWKMLPLLLIATLVFYLLGIIIETANKSQSKRASILTTFGTCLGIGLLFYFKYLNFFIESFSTFFNAIGLRTNFTTFNILMPLGISFFTFKLISYIIEVHREHIPAEKNFITFATFIAFFPTILSGPIDRPQKFLPQLQEKRKFNYDMAVDGCKQILWGMFKKMVIADVLTSSLITPSWENMASVSALQLIIAALFYPLVMYTDFSGYSDMAIGIGKLLGIKVAINFKYPFFSRNIAEYWRGWHISLTSWLTDYVFMPLNIAFRNLGIHGSILAIIINLVFVGMWHGANWTYFTFGLYHGILFIPLIYSGAFMSKKKMKTNKRDLPSTSDFFKMLRTYLLVAIGHIIFISTDLNNTWEYISHCCSSENWSIWQSLHIRDGIMAYFCLAGVLILEWRSRNKYEYPLLSFNGKRIFKWSIYILLLVLIIFYQGKPAEFIYFQF